MIRSTRRLALLPLAALVAGLGLAAASPATEPAPAPVNGPVNGPAAAASVAPAAETWRVDGVHSSVIFRIRHMDASNFYGAFKDLAGRIVIDESDSNGGSVEFTAQAGSVDTRNAKRDQHVMSPDFLAAKEFPEITYKSTKLTKAGDGWTMDGELTLHGVTKPLQVQVTKTGEAAGRGGQGKVAGFETHFEVKRSDFGMDNMLDALGDEIGLIVSLEVTLES